MVEVTVRVCNVCQDRARETKRYTVGDESGRGAEVDLCEEHGEPLEGFLGEPPKRGPKGPQKRSSGRSRIQVTPIEEVERLKGV